MYGCKVMFQLRPDSLNDFNRRLETDIVPMLRKQKGFQDVINLVSNDKRQVHSITLWDKAEHAEAHRAEFTKLAKMLENVVEGTPRVETMEVATSTIHKLETR